MRSRRGAYLAVFVIAALGAGILVYASQPRERIVRATADIPALSQITADKIEPVTVSPADAPARAARSLDAVVGRYASVPILAGQDVDVRILEANPGEIAFGFAAPLEAGQVAFAIPLDPGQAVGGALIPGARVDVVAVPNALKTQLSGLGSQASGLQGSGSKSTTAVILGQGLVVLTLRTPEGKQLGAEPASEAGRAVIPPKLGSVVVAIPAARLPEFAEAALTSTFYLALNSALEP
jgi:Flp pilus assembly protein CpaB